MGGCGRMWVFVCLCVCVREREREREKERGCGGRHCVWEIEIDSSASVWYSVS